VVAVIRLTASILAWALIAMLALAVPALGGTPPGSALDEYTETLPGAGGDHNTNVHGGDQGPSDHGEGGAGGGGAGGGGAGGGGAGGGGAGGGGNDSGGGLSEDNAADNVSPTTLGHLKREGTDGAAAAQLAQSTAPPGVSSADAGTARGGDQALSADNGAISAGEDDSRGGIGQVLSALTGGSDSSGMGLAFPLILIVALIVAIAIALARLRTRYDPSA
jgi:hypothetical protein